MIPYSLHLAILTAACWLFYKTLLQNETYYKLNRIILLVCLGLAFILPLIPVAERFSLRPTAATETFEAKPPTVQPTVNTGRPTAAKKVTPIVQTPKATVTDTPSASTFSINQKQLIKWAVWIYWFGVAAFALNFLVQLIALLYQLYKHPFIQDGIYRIVEMDGDKAPCSFGRTIFINPAKYDWDTYSQILMHEKVHIKQGHSLDLILAELMLVVQWFNPFAWLYRKEMESNLEFLTDDSVIHQHKVAPEAYQMSLVKVAVPNLSMRITTNYNQSLLKRRMIMMNAKRSNLHNIWKYCMLVPFLVLLLCVFNEPIRAIAKQLPKNTFTIGDNGKVYTATGDTTIKVKDRTVKVKFGTPSAKMAEDKADNNAVPVETLAAMSDEGITAGYIKSFKDIGYGYTAIETMRTFYNADITAGFVKSFMDIGYKYLAPETILSFYNADITAGFVKSFQDIKYGYTTPENILTFYNADITAGFIKSFQDIKYGYTSPETILTFYNADITAGFVKSFQDIKYGYTSPETIVTFYNADITAGFVKSFQDIKYGYTKPETILNFYNADITAGFVKSFQDIKYGYTSPETILSFYNADITAGYIKSFQDIGYKYTSPETILTFYNSDITAGFIKSFLDIKYPYVSPENIQTLYAKDITAGYIKSFQEQGKDTSPEGLEGKIAKPKTKKKP